MTNPEAIIPGSGAGPITESCSPISNLIPLKRGRDGRCSAPLRIVPAPCCRLRSFGLGPRSGAAPTRPPIAAPLAAAQYPPRMAPPMAAPPTSRALAQRVASRTRDRLHAAVSVGEPIVWKRIASRACPSCAAAQLAPEPRTSSPPDCDAIATQHRGDAGVNTILGHSPARSTPFARSESPTRRPTGP